MKKSRFFLEIMVPVLIFFLLPGAGMGQSTGNYSICQGSTEAYWIQGPNPGSTFGWTITPGTSGTNWTITANNNSDILVNWILPGVYAVQVIETSMAGCVGDPLQVTITVFANPSPANAGPDQSLCASLTATLAANTPVTGTGTWSMVSGPGTAIFGNVNDPLTTVTVSLYGTYILRWTTTSGLCPASTDDVSITFNQKPVTNGIWHN